MPKPNAAYLRSPTIPVAEIDDDMSRSVAAAAKHDADLVGQIERLRAAMLDIAGHNITLSVDDAQELRRSLNKFFEGE